MFIFLLTSLLQPDAFPVSTGPETTPTIMHTILWGIAPRSNPSEIVERSLSLVIRSCLLTTAACVYSAIHQNVPHPNAGYFKRLAIRLGLGLIALAAPEAMLWWALRQFIGAWNIRNEVNKINPKLKWTLTHGHFLQMGGIGVLDGDEERILYPPTFINLLTDNRFDSRAIERLTKKRIDDRSKGDILSKVVIVLQTTGFMIECFARLHQKLPLTNLEVATLAFATLNLFTYTLWLFKPLNVLCPTYLQLQPGADPIIPSPPPPTRLSTRLKHQRTMLIRFATRLAEGFLGLDLNALFRRFLARFATRPLPEGVTPRDDIKSQYRAICRSPWRLALLIVSFIMLVTMTILLGVILGILADLIPAMIISALFAFVLGRLFVEDSVDDTASHVSMFYAMKMSKSNQRLVWVSSCFVGMLFGAIHFLSWHSHFPTHLQLILWRISTLVMVVGPFCLSFGQFFLKMTEREGLRGDMVWLDYIRIIALVVVTLLGLMLVFLGTVFYIFSRLCIIVLAFVTLRHVPPGALETIAWATYVPHF